MPRYYFHLRDRADQLRDEEGMALPDAEAAWYQAVRAARELVKADIHLGCSYEHKLVEIVDEEGLRVDTLPLQAIADYSLFAS
jgi:hypothetical protein